MGRRRRSKLPPGFSSLIGAFIVFAAARSVREYAVPYYILLGIAAACVLAAAVQYLRRNG